MSGRRPPGAHGARAAGMRPVLVTNAAYPRSAADPYRPELVIDDLPALLNP